VEQEDAILKDAERLIHQYHDPSCHAMSRIILAPCSPFSVTPGLMKEAAQLARSHQGVHLHSHLAEDLDEGTYCDRVYGMRSVDFAASVDWLGPDVWFAHAIFLNDREISLFAETRTGMVHCASCPTRGEGETAARQCLNLARMMRSLPSNFDAGGQAARVGAQHFQKVSVNGGGLPVAPGGEPVHTA